MLDYSPAHWATFLGAAILLNISPGPDIAFILGQTARGGRGAGFAAMFGIWTGTLVHVLLAALGLSAILVASALVFGIVKWAGAGYLVWLGVQAWRSSGRAALARPAALAMCHAAVFRQGVLVSALNPKVAVFFLAFLPQFVVAGAGPVSAQLFLHGILIIVVAALVEPLLVVLGARLARALGESRRAATWLSRGLGTLLVGLGVRLALGERS